MAANKRRKLDGSGSSTPTAMSAFAARQQLWGIAAARNNGDAVSEPAPEDEAESKRGENPSARAMATRSSKPQSPKEPVSAGLKQTQSIEGSGPSTPRPEPSGILIRQHSSFKPSKKNLQRKAGGRLVLTIPEGERLVILGSFGVKVREGEATIAGAILTASDPVQWVHAPHCHAVPVLRTADDTVLELQSHPAAKGLRQLATLNHTFAKLWNESAEGTASSKSKSPPTFQIIYTSQDVPRRAVLQELTSPGEWNKKLSGLAAAKRKGTPVIFLCGPKSSGEVNLRAAANEPLHYRPRGFEKQALVERAGARYRPGQPEYSPPGVVSLARVTSPNLSPSFCHPILTPEEGQLRAHAIASVTPALDPAHFIECVLDLFAHYQRSPDANSPLVVNTPGWIQGTGLDILTELIVSINPTELIYMSQDGPEETVNSLQAACTSTAPPTPFSTLPSQPSEASSRTSLHFRTMQTMSYFHLQHQPPAKTPQPQPYPTWDPTPLTDLHPWRVRYAGADRGVLGILCYDQQPAPALLAEAINGTVLALVRLESRDDALRDLLLDPPPPGQLAPLPEKKEAGENEDSRLPLIPNPHSRTLSPRHSRLLGLVLLRGIDAARRELQLLTPLARDDVLAGPRPDHRGGLVLVAGRFDTPTWAYGEWLCRGRRRGVGGGGDGGDGDDEDDDDDDDDDEGEEEEEEEEEEEGDDKGGAEEGEDTPVAEEVPWVETLHGSQRRAVGSKVWRVRRDLGRN